MRGEVDHRVILGRNFWDRDEDRIRLLLGERMLLLDPRSIFDLNYPLAIKFSFLF